MRARSLLFLVVIWQNVFGQDQYMDSVQLLVRQYHLDWKPGAFDSSMAELDRLEERLKTHPNAVHLGSLYEMRGRTYGMRRQYARSTFYFMEALKVRESTGDSAGLARTWMLVGDQNFYLGNTAKAVEFGRMAHAMALRTADSASIGRTANGLGYYLLRQGAYDEAEDLFQLALKCNSRSDSFHISNNINNLGMARLYKGDRSLAVERYRQAAGIRARMRELPGLAESLHGLLLCDTLGDRRVENKALLDSCLAVASKCRDWNIMADCHRFLSTWHRRRGSTDSALWHLEQVLVLSDSFGDQERVRALLDFQDEYFKHRKETERAAARRERELHEREMELASERRVNQERTRRNLGLAGGLVLLIVASGLWWRLRYTARTKKAIEREKRRSEELLLNILPEEVAEELKAKGEAEAVQIEQVTVLFTDFKGFTALSEKLSPQELVRDLNECFSAFDRICEKHGIEKIKTIGDAYMAAGGLPVPNTTHPVDVINAALDMCDHIAMNKERKAAAGLPYFEVRIGIHTGPVVAGIVGVKKFQYDIWGDTVNTASRMESSGDVGQVNISEATYALVREQFDSLFHFTTRGKIQAKGKGELEMYFVHRVNAAA